jgi:hypothetical protein
VAFLIGLRPDAGYEVAIEGERKRTETADRGGILEITIPRSIGVEIRLRETSRPPRQ